MGFATAIGSCLRQYAGFRGRASRPEYWWFALAVFMVGLVAAAVDALLFGTTVTAHVESVTAPATGDVVGGWAGMRQGPMASAVGLLSLLPATSVAVRRLHDTERSGWFLLLPFAIAFFGPVLLFYLAPHLQGIGMGLWVLIVLAALVLPLLWFLQAGTPGPNRFGPDPLEAPLSEAPLSKVRQ